MNEPAALTAAVRGGVVESFDDTAGLGVVVAGQDRWPFHCVEIADGSRHIEVGTAVTFRLGWRRPGVREAIGIAATSSGL